jgi:thiosulfate/3-mercaptopyruvate sulfurtransferase
MILLRLFSLVLCAMIVAPSTVARAADSREAMLAAREWLARHLSDPNLVLLHVGTAAEYAKTHIPGARLVTLDEVSVPMDHSRMGPTDLMLEMPGADALRGQLQALGISDDSTVVVYYGNDHYSPSTRILFTLRYAGLSARAHLLDGGMPGWIRDGRPTTAEVPARKTGRLSPLRIQPVIVDAAFVQANTKTSGIAIVDARDRVFYDGLRPAGSGSGQPQSGHVPGALSVPFGDMFDERGNLRPAAELEAIFTKAGVKPGDTVVGYCHIGQQATAMLFAAATLGHEIRLYDGSMGDWVTRGLPLQMPGKDDRR